MSFSTALSGSIALLRDHAIFAGLSTGANYSVVSYLARVNHPERRYLFIAADTGHRYVEAVFNRHREAEPLARLRPHVAQDLDGLRMPWTSMAWNRKTYEYAETETN
jgi:cysteine synthase A